MPADTAFTVAQVAERLGVSEGVVLSWIAAGELKAVNVSRSPRPRRPRWRVTAGQLEAFEAGRTSGPSPAKTPRRRPVPASRVAFYPE
jgi:excisionase family DNA binding protein